jgi:ribose transport system substrate-binding protein
MKRILPLALALLAASALRADDPYQVAVIPKGTTDEYWKSIHAGALQAQRELKAAGIEVVIIWKGPLREDDREQQVQVVENFIGRQVSGIVLAPLDAHALVAPVEEAVGAHIPVVVIDSGLKSSLPSSVVATDNRQGGRLAARRLGELLGGKGKVILLRYMVGSASTEEREEGFLEVMHRDFPGIELVSTEQHAGATRDSAKRAAENLLNRYGAEVAGVFASNESSASGMLLALRDAGLAGGKVKFVGFDASQVLDQALVAGDVQGLIVQDPVKMGYLGVKTLVAVLRGEKVPATVDTGVGLVTPQNMNEPAQAALLHPAAE